MEYTHPFIGKKIVGVRHFPEEETGLKKVDEGVALAIVLDDGTLIFPSRDIEGNAAGMMFYNDDGKSYRFMEPNVVNVARAQDGGLQTKVCRVCGASDAPVSTAHRAVGKGFDCTGGPTEYYCAACAGNKIYELRGHLSDALNEPQELSELEEREAASWPPDLKVEVETADTPEAPEARRKIEINFRLQGHNDVRPGWTTASDPQAAIQSFLTDYSPSMGRIVWIEAVTDESSARRNEEAYDHIRDRKVVEKVELQSIRDTTWTVTPYRG